MTDYRLLKIETVGSKQDVRVFYYDTSEYKLRTKMDRWPHIIFSREVVPEKHKFSSASIVEELERLYPGHNFVTKAYNIHRKNSDEGTNIFTDDTDSFVVWHMGDRDAGDYLEFFLRADTDQPYTKANHDRKKQIFFRNGKKQFLATSKTVMKEELLHQAKAQLEDKIRNDPSYANMEIEDIRIRHKRQGYSYLEFRCTEEVLNKLPAHYFRIVGYESEVFKKEEDAESLLLGIRNSLKYGDEYVEQWEDKYYDDLFPQAVKIKSKVQPKKIMNIQPLEGIIDHLRIFQGFDEKGKDYYTVRLESTDSSVAASLMEKLNFKSRNRRDSRKEKWDPLELDNPTMQLRHFFPLHMPYNPEKPLVEQQCTKTYPFGKSPDAWNLERTISEAKEFMMENFAALDVEVIDWTDAPISGRMYMATLDSQRQKIIYMTREAWHTEEIRDAITKSFPDIRLEFSETETDMIAQFSRDAQEYLYHEHLKKFNGENELLKQGKITKEQFDAIRTARRSYRTADGKTPPKLWIPNTKGICDPLKYFIYRNKLFGNNKLATIMGFEKPLGYDELTEKIKSGTIEGLREVISYQARDGNETRELAIKIMVYGLLEALAVNKQISSVFDSEPVKNFYDSGQRRYMMIKHTHRDRHEMSFRNHLKKLEERSSPEDIFSGLIKKVPQRSKVVEGGIYYASPLIETFKPLLFKDPVTRHIYEKMLEEKDLLLKLDLIWKLSAYLCVPIDKAKNFMQAAGKEFGKIHSPEEIYPSLNVTQDLVENFFKETSGRETTDFELSRTAWIYSLEYGASSARTRNMEMPYYLGILDFNNEFAERLDAFKKEGFAARSRNFVVSDVPQGLSYGYYLGDVRAVNLRNDRMIARFTGTMNGKSYSDIYQKIRRFEHPVFSVLLEDALNGNFEEAKAIELASKLSLDERNDPTFQDIFKTITGRDLISPDVDRKLRNPQKELIAT
jgi:hypothetical protein